MGSHLYEEIEKGALSHPLLLHKQQSSYHRVFPTSFYSADDEHHSGDFEFVRYLDESNVRRVMRSLFEGFLHLTGMGVTFSLCDVDWLYVFGDLDGEYQVKALLFDLHVHVPIVVHCSNGGDAEHERGYLLEHVRWILNMIVGRYILDTSMSNGTYDGWNEDDARPYACTGQELASDTLLDRMSRALRAGSTSWTANVLGSEIRWKDPDRWAIRSTDPESITSEEYVHLRRIPECDDSRTSPDHSHEYTLRRALNRCRGCLISQERKVAALNAIYHDYISTMHCINGDLKEDIQKVMDSFTGPFSDCIVIVC